MKKSLETELKTLAEKILSANQETAVDELKAMASELYEKLSVLSYTKKYEREIASRGEKREEILARESIQSKSQSDEDRYAPDGTQYNPEAITEPNTEKIKDIVAQMPSETHKVEEVLGKILPEERNFKDDLRNIGVHYDDLPQFEPVETSREMAPTQKNDQKIHPEKNNGSISPSFEPKERLVQNPSEQKKSLNDRLKKGISFGLNDRLVFIKHLFDGNAADYDRVLSQLNTFHSFESAKRFIENVVKPDYNQWKGEEAYEQRFLNAIDKKLN